MKTWWVILLILLLAALIRLILPQLKFLSFVSPQSAVKLESLTGEFDPTKTKAFFNNNLVIPPLLANKDKETGPVLGETNKEKRIEVDLTNQRLYGYEGDQKVYEFAVSTGKWGRTPKGRFHIWIKVRYTLMTGGSKTLGTYYYLPNVPYTMFFYNEQIPAWRGFGIHGTYWHDNFGHPMSHGCINMKTEEVELLYYWAKPDLTDKKSILATKDNPGTEIIIYGDPPNE
jgi:hypothetical protein